MAVAIRHLRRRPADLAKAATDEAYDTLVQGVRHLRSRPASRPDMTGFVAGLIDTMSTVWD